MKIRSLTITVLFLTVWFNTTAGAPTVNAIRTKQKVQESLKFCRQKGYNTRYCILVDMGVHSGLKRFVIWDFKHNKPFLSSLVSHGCGNSPWSATASKEKP